MNNKTKKQDCNDGNRKSDFRTVTDYCFCLTREKVSGKGEDSFFFDIDREKGIIGVPSVTLRVVLICFKCFGI